MRRSISDARPPAIAARGDIAADDGRRATPPAAADFGEYALRSRGLGAAKEAERRAGKPRGVA